MEKRQEILTKIAYYSFYIAVMIEVLMVIIDKSALVNPIEGRLFQITFLLFFIKVCLTRYSLKKYGAIVLFLGLGAVSYFATGRNEIIRVVMFIAACKDIDMKKCLKLVFYLTLSGCALIIILSLLGIGGAVSLTQDYGRGNIETRYTLGMGHPNALQCMVWAMTVLGLYLYGESLKWYGYLAIAFLNIFFFFLTDSKTSLLVGIFSIIYTGLDRVAKDNIFRKVWNLGGILLTAGSILLSVIIAAKAYYVYNYAWGIDMSKTAAFYARLDRILTGRIRTLVGTTRWEGTTQTWSLFSESANNYYFDMGWIRLFYWYGIIPACIFITILFLVLIYCMKKKDSMAFVMIVSFAVYSLVEAHAVSVYLARNYVLFLIGMCWCQMLEIKERISDENSNNSYTCI